jgi:hypothetical protein
LWLPLVCVITLLIHPSRAETQAPDSLTQERAARALLSDLAGRWSYQVQGPTHDAPAISAIRVYRLVGDSSSLTWYESTPDGRSGHGVLWYDPRERRFFYVGVHSPAQAGVLLVGDLDSGGHTLTLHVPALARDALPFNQGMVASTIRLVGPDLHTWSRYDNGWVIAFRRQQ